MWKDYHNLTKNLPPHLLTIKAFKYVKNKDNALDLGSGSYRDSRFLVRHFKSVVGVDKEYFKPLKNLNFHFVQRDFKFFKYAKYNFINAQFSLPFLKPKDFKELWKNIKSSLASEGIFCGTLFGVHDEWVGNKTITFFTAPEVLALCRGFNVLKFKEINRVKKLANGKLKHWHLFELILKKP